ncbi:Fe-S cluster assembly protein NifU [Desulfococcus multivorans]|uniref:Nitrogen fixation protein NifU n=1 Tax=Desulfococcus multivorans DSM 2059 TaxID=1121405 RepID=S7TPW3_DESML|nr:Fe-S cluster assembly protein NifU [Desulfococcus multivorans]AOY57913.1 iron-sulfur cluster assembly protein (NifU like protein) [Desulfococcus multivorans]AQV00289.1 iron-sulfur cluster assembly scaffold protein NifU [Desulfococcus multivorans]EPR38996.1 Fe-S cluster assembly protein NifU [Desulfococcus multivorans DSM 2059]SJZ65419.1 NifU-like protein [Desulfococcus multivorans DSM 2059]
MWEYSDKVKEHFLNPRNVGVIEDADGVGEVGSISCGDALKLTFKVDENERIVDVKFQTFGCASAIASSSALTEMLKGKTIEEAEKITNDDIANYLGGLPKEKMHCSVMGQEALEKAIACYRGKPLSEKEGEIVCECFGVTDVEIRRALTEHRLSAVEDVTHYIKAGGGCGNCHDRIQELINEVTGQAPSVRTLPPKMTNIQKIRLIEETLEREIKPALKQDGGDIELVDVEGTRVQVKLHGSCSSCSAAQITLKDFVEKKLREFVLPELVVEEV